MYESRDAFFSGTIQTVGTIPENSEKYIGTIPKISEGGVGHENL